MSCCDCDVVDETETLRVRFAAVLSHARVSAFLSCTVTEKGNSRVRGVGWRQMRDHNLWWRLADPPTRLPFGAVVVAPSPFLLLRRSGLRLRSMRRGHQRWRVRYPDRGTDPPAGGEVGFRSRCGPTTSLGRPREREDEERMKKRRGRGTGVAPARVARGTVWVRSHSSRRDRGLRLRRRTRNSTPIPNHRRRRYRAAGWVSGGRSGERHGRRATGRPSRGCRTGLLVR